ncbi:MAG: glutamine-hydrolyzing GMP synthase [Sphingobacteriales bacterium]|nr:MAG: glutamine-hydrolyzing GMP synthase [Sphingobacteriales bacterium]
MHDKVIIFDFGSQYTQLIARRIRELSVYCEIVPYNTSIDKIVTSDVKGVILSGSPFSVLQDNALLFPLLELLQQKNQLPVLGVCYGAQYMAKVFAGKVEKSAKREYGRANLIINNDENLLKNIPNNSQIWMSHGDSILELPIDAELLASTHDIPVAAFKLIDKPVYGIQFHPEVTHSLDGLQIIKNFVVDICQCKQDWSAESFIQETVQELKNVVGTENVVLGLSGGVDSSVAALLLHKAIGKQLYCIFVNNGLLRYKEYENVLESYKELGLNIIGCDVSERFYSELEGITEPEAKRKIIGKVFIDVFQEEASKLENVTYLAQGTIYPDVIESVSVHGPSAKIKSHHNVGGLPEKMHLKIIEPLRKLFKDEVRRVGKALKLPDNILNRHPFPGPGLSIRILSDITAEKVKMLQLADAIFMDSLKEDNLYNEVWQAGVMLLPVQSVGVMGDERTYENVVALRAVSSVDGMTADWCHLPYTFLAKVSNKIINNVKGINRVVYDISSKPPATIEWE